MLPTLKEVIERLFTSRLIKIIFTTETFALGINMPSRSVIFDELRKYYGRFVRNLKTRDFYQMAGRAGRRGIDKEGFVYSRINPARIRFDEIREVIYNPPEEVRSQLNTSYATILNLYEKHKDEIYKIYPLSLHYFQSRRHEQREALRLIEAKLKLLKEMNYIDSVQQFSTRQQIYSSSNVEKINLLVRSNNNGVLTPKGLFAKTVYGYELILAELYEQNILEQLDEFGLGVVSCAVVFEPRKNQHMPSISKASRKIKMACEEIYRQIKDKERHFRIYPLSKIPAFHLSNAIEAWLRGTDFHKIIQLTDVDEGEVVRYFRMAVQILREINKSRAASATLKEKLKETCRVINRDIIDAEKQLREG
jgi:superfamily II RNA helicase